MIGVYFESWAQPWSNLAATTALAKIEKPIDLIFLSFVRPNCQYKKGQNSFAGTGLDFSCEFSVIKTAIQILKNKGIKVMLAVGGATYPFDVYQAQACADLMMDLGCDGLDIDWEPSAGVADAAKLGPIIAATRQVCPGKLVSLAGFSTGCYPKTPKPLEED